MNTYKKYCPNVFVAECDDQHKNGDVITLSTKRGSQHECEVHNYLGLSKSGKHLYSITRVDGFNSQQRAKNKSEKLNTYAEKAEIRSAEAYESRATKNELEFMRLGEPIKVGHHSEKRHRRLFEKYDRKMRKRLEEAEKSDEYKRRAEYWDEMASKIDLSIPESLEYFEFKLMEAEKEHKLLKDDPSKRTHSMSLQYAKKTVNELKKKVGTAIILWGEPSEVHLYYEEKKQEAINKNSKKKNEFLQSCNAFFAFNSVQFKEGYEKLVSKAIIERGDKVTHVGAGCYIPKNNVDDFVAKFKS